MRADFRDGRLRPLRHWVRGNRRRGYAAGLGVVAMLLMMAPGAASSGTQAGFDQWVANFEERVLKKSYFKPDVVKAAFDGVKFNSKVVDLDKSQPEFVKPIWEYLNGLITEKRLADGKAAMEKNAEALKAIEEKYGVPASVVAAIWGVESSFGQIRGDYNVIEALASLAYDGRPGKNGSRRAFWDRELRSALGILMLNETDPKHLKGSWAGAMGHTQFIPTSYHSYAVDFREDGKRDIWSDDPTDALASTANYLARSGWAQGEPWGFHVSLPSDFDYALIEKRRSTDAWTKHGVTLAGGGALPTGFDDAELILPAGHRGAAFLTLKNFRAILRYNNATSYGLAVSLLSDRLGGKPAPGLAWPNDDRPLKREERLELQEKLTELGFNTKGVDGILGADSKSAIRGFQGSNSMIADGYPSASLLADVRRALEARNAPVLASAAGPAETQDVREIQALLNGLGYDTGGVDGMVGSRTLAAIEKFLTKRGADLPHEPSKQLLAELRRAVRGQ